MRSPAEEGVRRLRSMTGFGRGSAASPAHAVVVTVRAVNHRHRDLAIRLRDELAALEPVLRKRILAAVERGKIDVSVNVRHLTAPPYRVLFNRELFAEVLVKLRQVADDLELGGSLPSDALLARSEILSWEAAEEMDVALLPLLETALDAALAEFNAMREHEGESLRHDLEARISHLEGLVETLDVRAEGLAERILAGLQTRLAELVKGLSLDSARLAQEAAMIADRGQVTEEIIRLGSHLRQLRRFLSNDTAGSVGKRLDFLTQELHREISTLGAKCRELDMLDIVLDFKTEIEKIREQVQNIE